MWKKQIVIFFLMVMMTINSIVPMQVKAADKLTIAQVCKYYGLNTLSTSANYQYFVFFYDSNGTYPYYFFCTNDANAGIGISVSSGDVKLQGVGYQYYSKGVGSGWLSSRVSTDTVLLVSSENFDLLYCNCDSITFTGVDNVPDVDLLNYYAPIATPTPKPTATNTPTPTPTNTPKPTATNTPTPTATNTPTPTPRITSRPTATPRLTATPRPTATPRLTATPRPTATIRPTYTPTNSDIQSDVNSIVDVVKVVISLFGTFPLNVILIGWILIIGIGLYKLLKDSVK